MLLVKRCWELLYTLVYLSINPTNQELLSIFISRPPPQKKELKGFVFLASVLGLKNECFCSNSEAVSPSPGLQPPPLMLSPPPQNNTDPLDMETHSHPCTYNSHTCIHTKCSYTPTHTQITYSHTQAYTHSHVVIHSNHIYMAHNSLAHTHTHTEFPQL